ncbi:MAG: CopG family transcriptional regulator [Betaproteobacteria bacterium]|nr:CopG family transcriptional regulator [Betaproteobacteria bacterium]
MASVTLTLSTEEKSLLDQIAVARHRSEEDLATEALRDYLRFEAEQMTRIREGIIAADGGDFATDAEVEAFFGQHAESR